MFTKKVMKFYESLQRQQHTVAKEFIRVGIKQIGWQMSASGSVAHSNVFVFELVTPKPKKKVHVRTHGRGSGDQGICFSSRRSRYFADSVTQSCLILLHFISLADDVSCHSKNANNLLYVFIVRMGRDCDICRIRKCSTSQ